MKKTIFSLLFTLPFLAFGQDILINPFITNAQMEQKINYWENGKVLSEIQYLDGKREGVCRYWYKTGQLKSEVMYKNGKMSGAFISYFENGQVESFGSFKYAESGIYSRKDGIWKYYYANGQLESESIIKKGVEELKFYDKQGNLLTEGEGC